MRDRFRPIPQAGGSLADHIRSRVEASQCAAGRRERHGPGDPPPSEIVLDWDSSLLCLRSTDHISTACASGSAPGVLVDMPVEVVTAAVLQTTFLLYQEVQACSLCWFRRQ